MTYWQPLRTLTTWLGAPGGVGRPSMVGGRLTNHCPPFPPPGKPSDLLTAVQVCKLASVVVNRIPFAI